MPLPADLARVAETHSSNLATLNQAALQALAQAIRSGSSSPEAWRESIANISQDLLSLQTAAAAQADSYVTAALQAQGASTAADATVNPSAFADLTDGGGSWLRNLIYAPNATVARALSQGVSRPVALSRGQLVANSIVLTGMQDVGRSAAQAAMLARHNVKSYVRMLKRPSCARCAILAGRHYHAQTAFKRHPRCDCVNVPVAETAEDLTTDPMTYFRSLSESDQDQIFGNSGAQAIRDGANISQVVNAYEGVVQVSSYGRDVLATTTGTTTRGLAGQVMRADGTLGPRLLPDEIYSLSERLGWGREELLRQLQRFGYIT